MKGLTDVFGVMMVEIVVVPVAVAAMMTTIRASLPDRLACAIARRPRGKFPWPSFAAGLDCPETGPGAVPKLLSEQQIKLVSSGDKMELANEIYYSINKIRLDRPNISYSELTDGLIAAGDSSEYRGAPRIVMRSEDRRSRQISG